MSSAVLRFTHIKTIVLSLALTGLSASAIQAASLTPQERNICPELQVCVDIIKRHDASEFDYSVLENQFRRFGPPGRTALFSLLNTDAGNADIAHMIAALGPLSLSERSRLKAKWSLKNASTFLPLLLDGHPVSRDLLLLTLGSDQPSVREGARLALLQLPQSTVNQPLPATLREPLLSSLARDPVNEAAPYVARLNAMGGSEKFARLLRSGETAVVAGAYQSLHRDNPAQAFKLLLSEMEKLTSPQQSRAIGEMLVSRHPQRSDGFYLKFARDISGDETRAIPARASGLHAFMIEGGSAMPDFTPARAQALSYLVRTQSFFAQDKYLPYLKRVKAEQELNYIWNIAQQEKWINRDRISEFFEGEKIENIVINDLLNSDDLRSFRYGIGRAKPVHNNLVQTKTNHPIRAIGNLARRKLDISTKKGLKHNCRISSFDSADIVNQMPYFETAWVKSTTEARISLGRKYLTTAHPSKTGWLAGYDLEKPKMRSAQPGGALVHFDNNTAEFIRVGEFSGPIAILPHRSLKLGETTEKFWVIDRWSGESGDLSAYRVNLSGGRSSIQHLGALPKDAQGFTVAPNGDLLMRVSGEKQPPLRLTQRGNISLACAATPRGSKISAPN